MKEVSVEKVIKIVNECIEGYIVKTENLDDELMDFGMDSINFIQLIVTLEEQFECEIPNNKILYIEMNTVNKILVTLFDLYNNEMRSNEK